ncbi:GNAT family N-acetyltransferase [Rhizobium sp. PAMB 3174]
MRESKTNHADLPNKPGSGPANLIIRPVHERDLPALFEIVTMPGFRAGTLRLPFQRFSDTEKWFAAIGPEDISIVAELNGKVVGDAGARRFAGRRAHVARIGMGLHDDYHRRGIGSALLAAIIDAADNWHDIRRLELEVFADNKAAIGLYRKFGFQEEGLLRGYAYRNGTYADALVMARLCFDPMPRQPTTTE